MSMTTYDKSLSDVHQSVDTTSTSKPVWRRILAFFGPAYMVSVGYMDPGNWATDLAGGSQFGYRLIWVLLMSNLMALLLQNLSARLGVVRGRDLAQANRETYPKPINICLYVLAEIAIAACDLAEVTGMAIGLQLLTGIPLLWGVLITLLDTFLLMVLQRLGIRKMEAFIICLIALIGGSFLIEVFLAKPSASEIVRGLIPTIPNQTALYLAVGIIGATIMPHNLYLHSALVQTRKIKRNDQSIRRALRFNLLDSTIALNLAFLVNAAILILAAATFFKRGLYNVGEIKQAHLLLHQLMGSKVAPYLFAISLIASGQSSTITGTLAGQIVMEGYLRLRINPWIRRFLTRAIAILPAVLVIAINGEENINNLIVLSQVVLSIQLGFAIIPLIHFVSDKKTMGSFRIKPATQFLAWLICAILIYLNLKMVAEQILIYMQTNGHVFWKVVICISCLLFLSLLLITFIYPFLKNKPRHVSVQVHNMAPDINREVPLPAYKKVAVAVDFSELDLKLLAHAMAQAEKDSSIYLIHIVESVPARLFGLETDDFETRDDQQKLNLYVSLIQEKGYRAVSCLGFNNRTMEIARLVKEAKADLLIIGAHGHKGIKDLIYGTTIDSVRHQLKIPVLIINAD
jgi:manganese transport protein